MENKDSNISDLITLIDHLVEQNNKGSVLLNRLIKASAVDQPAKDETTDELLHTTEPSRLISLIQL